MHISSRVPHDDFREGFTVGFQLIQGIGVEPPAAPAEPDAVADTTRFLLGVRAGIAAAGGKLT
ncbi:hypothetical protein [Bradyrhizobium sp. P5_C11_2]